MATLRLVPSTYTLSSTSYLSISNASNMYANTDSTNYATITNSRASTTSYYVYIKGFNFSDVPDNAIVNSFTIKFKAYESGVSTSTSYRPYICNNTTTLTCSCDTIGTSATTLSFTGVSDSWETIKGYGSNFGIRINCRRASKNTTSYMYVYGAEILVDYTIAVERTITTTVNGEAEISPSGTTTVYDGDPFELSITSATKPTVMDNGNDVTGQLTEQAASGSVYSYPTSYSTSGSISGTYYTSAVGQGSDTSSTTTNNCYCSTSGSTAYISYSFDLSSVPSGAVIQSVACTVKGHCESTSASTEVADVQLYSGSTAKGSKSSFTSTSNSVITLNTGTWTRSEIDSLALRFTIGYYGGLVLGATVTVTYGIEIEGKMYIYKIPSVSSDHTIIVSVTSSNSLYFKGNDTTWYTAKKVWKKINDSWVQQTDYENIFETDVNYIYVGE